MKNIEQSVTFSCNNQTISLNKSSESKFAFEADLKTETTTGRRYKRCTCHPALEFHNKAVKLVWILVAFVNISVQASPITFKNEAKPPKFDNFDKINLDNVASILSKSRRINEHNNLNILLKRLLSRRSRSSASSCEPTLRSLYGLVLHAYVQARNAHNDIRVRRMLTRHINQQNTWGVRWKIARNKLEMLQCDTFFYSNLFGDDTASIKSAISSMLTVLQQELKSYDMEFPQVSLSHCEAQHPDRGNKQLSAAQKRFLKELFDLGTELKTICDNLDN